MEERWRGRPEEVRVQYGRAIQWVLFPPTSPSSSLETVLWQSVWLASLSYSLYPVFPAALSGVVSDCVHLPNWSPVYSDSSPCPSAKPCTRYFLRCSIVSCPWGAYSLKQWPPYFLSNTETIFPNCLANSLSSHQHSCYFWCLVLFFWETSKDGPDWDSPLPGSPFSCCLLEFKEGVYIPDGGRVQWDGRWGEEGRDGKNKEVFRNKLREWDHKIVSQIASGLHLCPTAPMPVQAVLSSQTIAATVEWLPLPLCSLHLHPH